MKSIKHLLIISFLFICQNIFSQNLTQEQWNKIRNEAFYEFIQNGGTTQQWEYNSDKIAQDYYKRKYQTNKYGEAEQKKSYVKGTFLSGDGVEGYFYNNYVMNSAQQTLGYLKNGYFLSNSGQCVGYVKGSSVCKCDGTLIAYVNGDGFYNSQNYRLWRIEGETLYSNNQAVIKIVGMDMYSLAAFYLFIIK